MSTTPGTFLVTHVDPDSAVLREVTSSQVYTLSHNPGLTVDSVINATLSPGDAAGTVWELEQFEPYPLSIEKSSRSVDPDAQAAVGDAEDGTLVQFDRSWGRLHAIAVPDAEAAIEDIIDDPTTRTRAARLDAHTVQVQGGNGVVTVAYRQN